MKKLLTIIIVLLPLLASAQNGLSVVTLKNGTELKGTIKAIDPTDAVTIVIAGIETKIKMADVAKIEEANQVAATIPIAQEAQLGEKDKLIVTDRANYPETFDLKVGNETIKMILVRGGDMNMGYDGPGSRSMKSEPVHKVGVTSFYMSVNFVNSKVASEITGKASKKESYVALNWKKTNQIVQGIADIVGLPVRLPTEAEWEYAACSKEQDLIFNTCKDFEYCSDFFDDYKDVEYKVDPKGPDKGKNGKHVIRAYSQDKGKLRRLYGELDHYFRLVIKVKDVIDKTK